jgi:hypothetical protein
MKRKAEAHGLDLRDRLMHLNRELHLPTTRTESETCIVGYTSDGYNSYKNSDVPVEGVRDVEVQIPENLERRRKAVAALKEMGYNRFGLWLALHHKTVMGTCIALLLLAAVAVGLVLI